MVLALSLAAAGHDRDWGATLRLDATTLHDSIASNHPGPLNPDDPGFSKRNDAQLVLAKRRARKASSFAHYFYALRQYVASFDDGHLDFGVYGATPEEWRWPGFLTRYDEDGQQRVFARNGDGPVPVGARLIECNGKSAERLSAEIVGSTIGRWKLLSQRRLWGFITFTNTSNPYVVHPSRCRFDVSGRRTDVVLRWRPISFSKIGELALPAPPIRSVSMRTLADGTRWLSLPSFDSDPGTEVGKRLTALIRELDTNGRMVRSASRIVLDLRGNGGGSSDWSYQIARRIWGDRAVAARRPAAMTVTWRASAANLATIKSAYARLMKSSELSMESRSWFEGTIAGLESAIAARQPTWKVPPDRATAQRVENLPIYYPVAHVLLVTDATCMSACLDAVDLWRSLGAIHVGQETSADTLYMESRQDKLPSGLGSISLPMKVYRGRTRGSDEPAVPERTFHGDISNTAALETWIASLQ